MSFRSYVKVFIGGLLLLPFLVFGQTIAVSPDSQIERPELKLSEIFVNQNIISGKAVLKNSSSFDLNNLSYVFILSEKSKETKTVVNEITTTYISPGAIITTKTEENIFSLLAGDEQKRDFSLNFPASIPNGVYKLETRVVILGGNVVTLSIEEVNLTGTGEFLVIDQSSCVLLLNTHKFEPNDGPNVYPGEKFKISCKVSNLSKTTLSPFPKIFVAKFFTFGYPQADTKEKMFNQVTFKPGESKNITLEIDAFSESQVYNAALQFYKNDKAISGQTFFRWIVKGEAARIHNVVLSKSRYQKGEVAEVTVSFFASPDLFWNGFNADFVQKDVARFSGSPIDQPKFKVIISSGAGKLCGGVEKTFETSMSSIELETKTLYVPIEADCLDPRAGVSFSDRDKLLASVDYITRSATTSNVVEKGSIKSYYIYLVAGLTLLLAWYLKQRFIRVSEQEI